MQFRGAGDYSLYSLNDRLCVIVGTYDLVILGRQILDDCWQYRTYDFAPSCNGFGTIDCYGFILQCEFPGVGYVPPGDFLSEVTHHSYQELLRSRIV